MKNILLVAYHFPPTRGSSGLHRTLSMARYLKNFGWNPVVLTVDPRAYENTTDALLHAIPPEVMVCRAFARDTRQHYSYRKAYPLLLALPDRWVSWWFGGSVSGMQLIKQNRFDLIWSTYPIATAHLIGYTLHKLSRIPWVADFRDPMPGKDYSLVEPWEKRTSAWIEYETVRHASKLVMTTRGAVNLKTKRYPRIPRSHWTVIENGVDEDFFRSIEKKIKNEPFRKKKLTLLHSGILYPEHRDPGYFFAALHYLKQKGDIKGSDVEFVLRASTNETRYQKWIKEFDIEDLVFLKPGITYPEAIEEIISADGLMVFQSSVFNNQIPAKLYEYFRSGRPIIGFTDPLGDTAGLLKTENGVMIARLDNAGDIIDILPDFLRYCRDNRYRPVRDMTDRYSRQRRVAQYAKLFNTLVK